MAGDYIVLLLAFCLGNSYGSEIDFKSSPPIVTLGLSRNLTLRCSLSDTLADDNSGASIIGRRHTDDVRRDATLTETLYNTDHVMSMVITKLGEKNKTIATLTSKTPPTGNLVMGALEVHGNLVTNVTERAFLEVTWTNPSQNQEGIYQCLVNAVDPSGQPVVFVHMIEVGTESPSVNDLAERLVEVQNIYDKQMSVLQQASDLKNKEITTLQSQNQKLVQRISALEFANVNKDYLLADVQKKLNTLQPAHAERGKVACGHSDSWEQTNITFEVDPTSRIYDTGRASLKHITFARPYDSMPTIMVSPSTVSIDRARFDLQILNATPQGFDIQCAIWESGTVIFHLDVEWISVETS